MLWGIKPIQQQAAYGLAVEGLRRQIQLSLLLPSERMPAERKLAEELNVSRVTLREALRILETEGYISVKRGSRGGAFVANEETLNKIALHRISLDPAAAMRALEFREAVERVSAHLAAARRTPADLRRFRDSLTAIHTAKTGGELRRAETSFALALAEASHNLHFVHAVEQALSATNLPLITGTILEMCATSEALRRSVANAIESREVDAAEKAILVIIERDRQQFRSLPKVA
jgi:GntR family transcriptional regulator, transcriptional repressor for pyruvate dehydrogenase complex